ncbi:MAG: serine proteinase [Oscillospiraceae bacterium]|nr:serine proteinase [Oscillospiraceae bacterium]
MTFDDIRSQVTDLAQAGAAKTREMAEIVKLRLSNAAEEDSIRKAYTEIGKQYYAAHRDEPGEAFAALCKQIDASQEKIAYNKQKIADIRAAGNIPEDVQDADVEESTAPEEPDPAQPAEDDPQEPPVQ